MSRAEDFILEHTSALKESNGKEYFKWLTPDDARRAVKIAREELIEKACRGYCDDICEKGMCCCFKHNSKGQVKNTFKYNECYKLQILINAMKYE